ncbi:MAG: hypothetical protein ACT4P7_21185 [Gemmatimonadaceae bacterium]
MIRSTALGVLFLLACTEPARRPPPAGPADFGVGAPDEAVLRVGDAMQLFHQFHDSAGVPITAETPAYRAADPTIAEVTATGRVTARAVGETQVQSTMGSARVSTWLRVVNDASHATVIDVFPAVEHQRIKGWEGSGQFGEIDCEPEAFRRYHREIVDRVVNELGITRLRLSARSGTETSVDFWPEYRSGQMSYGVWRRTWMVASNDNDDPFVANPAGFQWGYFDRVMDTVFVPIRKALEARGESLYVNLNFVDFFLGAGSKAFPQMKHAEEYAELIRVVFDHMQQKYGFTPDGVELLLEPENTPYTATDVGRALVAVERRLRAGGYTPEFIGPSTTKTANAALFYDELTMVPGARGLLDEIAYHKYGGLSNASLRAIVLRGRRDGIPTAMLEHIGSGFDGMYEDLTIGNVSVWEQFTLAYCGRRDNAENPGVYYQINESDPARPKVNITNEAKLLRQVFVYVRPGAVRLGAASSDPTLRALAFRNASGRAVVVARSPVQREVAVRGLPAGTYGVNYSVRTGRYNVDLPDVTVEDGKPLRLLIPEDAAITVYGR